MFDDDRIERIEARCYSVPPDESAGRAPSGYKATSIIVAHAYGGGKHGIGYTYSHKSVAAVINDAFAEIITGKDIMDVSARGCEMMQAVQNIGAGGIAASAVAAVDNALWDLKARLLDISLVRALGRMRERTPVYGSGGLTWYSNETLREQLADWADMNIRAVKMKVGANPDADPVRVAVAREAIGADMELYVDAQGAFNRKLALAIAESFAEFGASWFEQPVMYSDFSGLRLIRDRAPSGMDIAAGKCGFTLDFLRRLLSHECIDIVQLDISRLGITGFMQAAALCRAFHMPVSTLGSTALHIHPAAAVEGLRNVEYSYEHVRVERMLFDGVPEVEDGALAPDLSRPGNGLELKEREARQFEE